MLKRYLTPKQRTITLLLWGSFILSVLAASWVLKTQNGPLLRELEALGWPAYLEMEHSSTTYILGACWRDEQCKPTLSALVRERYNGFSLALLALPFVALLPALIYNPGRPLEKKDAGEAAYATKQEVKALGLLGREPEMRGHIGYHKESGAELRFTQSLFDEHVKIVAGTGGGKTSGPYMNGILQDALDGRFCIVIDTKIPDVDKGMAKVIPFWEGLGRDVQWLLPYHPYSMHYEFIRPDLDIEDAGDLASVFYPHDEKAHEQYWGPNEQLLLKCLLAAWSGRGRRDLRELYLKVVEGVGGIKDVLSKDYRYRQRANLFFVADEMRQIGFLSGLQRNLALFDQTHVSNATRRGERNNVDLRRLTENGGLLYIGVPQTMINRGHGAKFLQLLFRRLLTDLEEIADSCGGRLPLGATLNLDEVMNMSRIPNLGTNLRTYRSRGITMLLGMQNEASAIDRYGGPDAWSGIVEGNVGTTLIFPGHLGPEDRERYSEILGEITTQEESVTKTRTPEGLLSGQTRYSRSYRRTNKKLLNTTEMQRMKRGEAIALIRELPPVRVDVAPYFKTRHLGHKHRLGRYGEALPETFDPILWAKYALERAENETPAEREGAGAFARGPLTEETVHDVQEVVGAEEAAERFAEGEAEIRKLYNVFEQRPVPLRITADEGYIKMAAQWRKAQPPLVSQNVARIQKATSSGLLNFEGEWLSLSEAGFDLLTPEQKHKLRNMFDKHAKKGLAKLSAAKTKQDKKPAAKRASPPPVTGADPDSDSNSKYFRVVDGKLVFDVDITKKLEAYLSEKGEVERYTPGKLIVEVGLFETLDANPRRKTKENAVFGGKPERCYGIRQDDLDSALRQFIDENKSELKGHPAYQGGSLGAKLEPALYDLDHATLAKLCGGRVAQAVREADAALLPVALPNLIVRAP